MRTNRLYLSLTTAFMICMILPSCYVQKNSEAHATILYESYPEMEGYSEPETPIAGKITVEENHESKSSLEALSASLLLIDFNKEEKVTRWEDNLSYQSNQLADAKQSFLDDESKMLQQVSN